MTTYVGGKRKHKMPMGSESDVDAETETQVSSKFLTRMSPSSLKKMIDTFSVAQRRDIVSIGFGGFLLLKTAELPTNLSHWLLQNFDPLRCSLQVDSTQLLHISEDDVHITFGLPKGKKLVVEAKKKDTEDFESCLSQWRGQWADAVDVTISMLVSRLKEQVEGGVDFKRNFVVYIVTTFLKGNQNVKCNFRVLKSLLNVEDIKRLNWCHYTLDSLVTSSENWRIKTTSYFKGPIFLLMLCYLDRVVFKTRNVPRQFPILSSWTRENIFTRVKDEMRTGSFGLGWLEKIARMDQLKDASPSLDPDFASKQNAALGAGDCVICLDSPVEGACIPCGHMAGCMPCLNEVKEKNWGCPVCRATIVQVVRLYACR